MNQILTADIKMPDHFSSEAADLITKLLEKVVSIFHFLFQVQPADRIGCRAEGPNEIKRHPWFKSIDWDKLLAREITPPYTPRTTGVQDT